jgi:hypothetical protein
MISKYEDAYFTVEVALLFPIVLLFTVMMIFWAFYAYDRSILEHSASQAAIRGTYCHLDTSEAVEKSKKSAASFVSNRVFAIKELSHDVKASYGKVTVSYHCVVNMPFQPWLREYITGFSDNYMTIDITKNATRLTPAKIIRESRTLGRMFNSIDEYNSMRE